MQFVKQWLAENKMFTVRRWMLT